MTHTFEFVVVKKQSEEDKAEGKEKEVLNLMYKTKSNRTNKVRDKIMKELDTKNVVKQFDIEEFYLRQLK